ncbi:AMP-binding protein [Streptosporangium roseum]|uniref:AMP-binding protein n=1 Tax=Streptosporangium roseum TaxID=2001 RepID=UPI003326AC4E
MKNTPSQSVGLLSRIRHIAASRGDAQAFVFVDHRGEAAELRWKDLLAAVEAEVQRIAFHARPGSLLTAPAVSSQHGISQLLAVLASGHTLLPLDPRSPHETKHRLIEQLTSQGAVVDEVEALLGPGGPASAAFIEGGYVLATGGTTGDPKLVHYPKEPAYRAPSALLKRTGWREFQTQLLAGPLHHAAPFSRLIDGVLSGNTIVVPRVFKAEAVLGVVERFGVEWAQLTPSNMLVLDDPLRRRPEAFRSLRGILHTAAPCPADTKRNWIKHLGADRVFEMYTSTEGIGATLCDGHEWLARPGTVGRGFFTRIRIFDDQGLPLPPGGTGTVHMRSVLRNQPAGTMGGYQSVGDRGHLDEDGYLFLSGRREDLIIVGGENVYVSEVTSAILSCVGVADAAVGELPDHQLGSRLCALVVRRPSASLTVADLLGHCLSRLEPYKVPSEFRFVDALPRTPAGKLERISFSRLMETL